MSRQRGLRDGHLVVTAEAALSATAFGSGGIGFLELTAFGTAPEAGCELMCGCLGSPLSSNVHPPNTLPFHVAGLEHSLHCQGSPHGQWLAQYLRQDALAREVGG